MDIYSARIAAEGMLDKILKFQPTLFQNELRTSKESGEAVARFCKDFIETYTDYLSKRA